MKIVQTLIFTIILIVGVIVLVNSFSSKNPTISAANYSNPTKIPISVMPIETPELTPTPITTKATANVQVIKATYGPPFGFIPTELIVKAGTPVRLGGCDLVNKL